MTILKRPERKAPKMVDVSYGYETSGGACAISFDKPETAREWFEKQKLKNPEFAQILKPVKTTLHITKEPF